MPICVNIIYGCVNHITAELSSCTHKPKIFTVWPCMKKFAKFYF